ncbi:MAG: hypothetical protein IPP71_20100 [Bacteroidetes bacterium]|nr:hypothetical protein [Bacteroidota bacterium]
MIDYNFGYAAQDYFINKKASNGLQLDEKNREMINVYGRKCTSCKIYMIVMMPNG